MTQPEPPQVIIIGLKEVLEEVKKVAQNQCDLVSRFDRYSTEQSLRVANLERSSEADRADIARLKEQSVTRSSMWTGIGTIAAVGTLLVAAVAIFK